MEEIWKVYHVSTREGLNKWGKPHNKIIYEISNLGRARKTSEKTGIQTPIKTYLCGGYADHRYLALPSNMYKYIHRLVALYFVPNPDPNKYIIVDHIDMNTQNNHWTNLRWTNYKGNNTRNPRQCKWCGKIGASNSFGNHIKWCKQNPNRNTPQWKD